MALKLAGIVNHLDLQFTPKHLFLTQYKHAILILSPVTSIHRVTKQQQDIELPSSAVLFPFSFAAY